MNLVAMSKAEVGIRLKMGRKRGACMCISWPYSLLWGYGTYLVKDTAIVGGDVVGVEEEAFSYYSPLSAIFKSCNGLQSWCVHLLKLVMGVEISTRPVSSSGR